MMRAFPPALAMLLIVTAGFVHGMRTGRWRTDSAIAEASARLAAVPMTVGDWDGQDVSLNGNDPQGASGHLCRKYVHRPTGYEVTVFLVCGRPGPVAIHTPDVCYGSSGFSIGTPVKYGLPGNNSPAAEFWTADMARTTASDRSRLRVFWAWAHDASGWAAADSPRMQFASAPALFKLYVLRELSPDGDQGLERDPCVEMMRALLPTLQRQLFTTDEDPAG